MGSKATNNRRLVYQSGYSAIMTTEDLNASLTNMTKEYTETWYYGVQFQQTKKYLDIL